MLTIYLVWSFPFFFVALMFATYKVFGYITIEDTLFCLVGACYPILRESALIAFITHKYHGIGNKVLFGERK